MANQTDPDLFCIGGRYQLWGSSLVTVSVDGGDVEHIRTMVQHVDTLDVRW